MKARKISLELEQPTVVGIVNATPDSFSGPGGEGAVAIELGLRHLEDGATIVEVGGESNVSNRPPVPADEEIRRVVPVVEALADTGAAIAIDTHKPAVARAALEAGAAILNDISGLGFQAGTSSPRASGPGDVKRSSHAEMIDLAAEYSAGVVVMHTETPPKTPRWQEDLYPGGVAQRVLSFFEQRLEALEAAGVGRDQVILDPGPDFAKTPHQTVAALRGLPLYRELGCPVMLAVSRKDFIGAIGGRPPRARDGGTFAAIAAGILAGGTVLRVHDVAGTVEFLKIWQALRGESEVPEGLRIDESVRREPAAR